jgi:hypothetical protein
MSEVKKRPERITVKLTPEAHGVLVAVKADNRLNSLSDAIMLLSDNKSKK